MRHTVDLPEALPRLRQHESIRTGLRRVLLDCIECTQLAMADQREAEAGRVHRARIALKRARAVLRLGDSCGLAWTAAARQRLVRLAADMAKVRDRAVVSETARKLGSTMEITGAAAKPSWPAWVRRVEKEQQRLGRCRWPVLTRPVWVGALADSVERLRKRERAAKGGAKPHRLHAWRKSVIVLREQLNVLRVRLPRRQQKYAAQLHDVARKLGTAQDLALLIAALQDDVPTSNRNELLARACRQRLQSVQRARRRARGLLARLERDFGVGENGF